MNPTNPKNSNSKTTKTSKTTYAGAKQTGVTGKPANAPVNAWSNTGAASAKTTKGNCSDC